MRFVILHHTDWPDHPEHFDLLLQVVSGGPDDRGLAAFATLADEFPSGKPPVRLRKLPDHRLAYLDFEGVVTGGRGSVARVAAGELNWPCPPDWDKEVVVCLKAEKLSGAFRLRLLRKDLYDLAKQ